MRPIKIIDNGDISYTTAYQQQQRLFNTTIEAKKGATPPPYHHLIICQHNPVFTLGRNAHDENILVSEEYLPEMGIEVHHISRGGDVTYHGPGQWTIYPIFDLEELAIGIRQYVYNLEEVAIEVLRQYGLKGERLEGASGVWMHLNTPRPVKICAIGIQASRYVTMHGIAFNVSTPPSAYQLINPCGFSDKGVTNLCIETGKEVTMAQAKTHLIAAFSKIFNRNTLI